MEIKVIGTIRSIGQTQTVGAAGTFKKRQLVIDTDEQYPQAVAIDFVQDKTDLLNNYSKGQSVSVSINIRGNEYNEKFYVSLNGWRIEKGEGAQTATPAAQTFQPATNFKEEEHDDLPF